MNNANKILENLKTVNEVADDMGVSAVFARRLCEQGRIQNAKKIGFQWIVLMPLEIDPPLASRGRPRKDQQNGNS